MGSAATTSTGPRPEVDLLDPTFHVGDPHPTYRWMRHHEPIYRDEANDLWCVTRMEHLRHVERHTEVFVSSRGYRSVWIPTETSMISKDDPDHTRQRRLIADRFTPRSVGALEDDVRAVVEESISGFAPDGPVEVVDALAARIPSIVTCRLIGWDDDRWRDVRSWSERLMRIDTMARDHQHATDGIAAVGEIAHLVETTLEARVGRPADDLLTVWAGAAERGCPMIVADINSELGLLIPGGAETTRTTLARALILFSERNDLWEQLAADAAPHPDRGRGAAALDHPAQQHVPHRRGRHRARRRGDGGGGPGGARLPVGEPRRGGVRRPGRGRPATRPQPPHRLRVRHALLPRCARRPPRAPRRARGADRSVHPPAGGLRPGVRGQRVREGGRALRDGLRPAMRTRLGVRLAAVAGAALLAGGLAVASAPAQASTTQEAPPSTILPTLPSEAEPLTSAVSPVVWQACRGVGLAVGLTVVLGTLAGVPPDVGVPLNATIATLSGPVLTLFFEVCQQIPLPDEPPDCAADAAGPAPPVARPPGPARRPAGQRAAGARQGTRPRGPAVRGRTRTGRRRPPGLRRRPEPRPGPGAGPRTSRHRCLRRTGDPGRREGGFGGGGPQVPSDLPDRVAGDSAAPDLAPPAPRPVSTSTSDGVGLAVALLILAGLASATWMHAGHARPAPRGAATDAPT